VLHGRVWDDPARKDWYMLGVSTTKRIGAFLLLAALPLASGACNAGASASTNPNTTPSQQPPHGQPPPYYGQQPPYGQPNQPPPPVQQRPLLAPLVGMPAMQQEVRSILAELVNALGQQNQALVRGIPLTFDPTPEVNAFAGCDEQGAPFLAATAGILEAVDAMAQTKATDELFETQTYEAYCNAVLPGLARSQNARAGLPAGIVPAPYGPDPRRWSRAHEIFDEIVAFTFGHELAHHYLGHTGCARGQGMGSAPDASRLGRLLTVVPLFNQAAEAASDSSGAVNALDAGRARRPQYEWNDAGALALLDLFARLERAAGAGGPLSLLNPVAVLKTHPNPLARIPWVQTVTRTWHLQHPG